MNMQNLNEILFSQARNLHMCGKVHKKWYGRTLSMDELFELYYANLDFCIDNQFPSVTQLKELLTDEQRRGHGMLADDSWSLLNPEHAIVLGRSKATIRFNAFNVGRVTVAGSSECEISVKGHARVVVHLYDHANVRVSSQDKSNATLIIHSDTCSFYTKGQTTVKECIG